MQALNCTFVTLVCIIGVRADKTSKDLIIVLAHHRVNSTLLLKFAAAISRRCCHSSTWLAALFDRR